MKSNRQSKREANRLFRQCVVNGLVDGSRARETVSSVLKVGRRDAGVLLTHFVRLLKLDGTRHAASVESAAPLAPELQSALSAGLTSRFGPGLRTSFTQRAELIGGLRIQVGCDVYDDTVLARLHALDKSF